MTKQQRRKDNEKGFKRVRRGWRKLKGVFPAQDGPFAAFVRTLPCIVCYLRLSGGSWPPPIGFSSEAAHVGDNRGAAQKCSGRELVPLCENHHRTGQTSHHRLTARHGQAFWDHWQFDRDDIVRKVNELYEKWRAA